MPPELEDVRLWLRKARHDWFAARELSALRRTVLDTVAFHCQQAVEKTLKAYLVSRAAEFEKTHDLIWLLDRCVAFEPEFDALREVIRPLSAYAVVSRYPGPAEPTRAQVDQALSAVAQAWEAVTRRLPPDVIPPEPEEI
jgi:HEPN domain-containing protein